MNVPIGYARNNDPLVSEMEAILREAEEARTPQQTRAFNRLKERLNQRAEPPVEVQSLDDAPL